MEIFDLGSDESASPRSRRRSLAKTRRATCSPVGVGRPIPLAGPERAAGFPSERRRCRRRPRSEANDIKKGLARTWGVRCAEGVVLEVDVAITTSGSSQAYRPVDHHVADRNCAQALREPPASGDGLGVRAFHYSTEPRPSVTSKIGGRYCLQAHV